MKKKKVKRPNPFGYPHYPAFDFYVCHGTVQVYACRGNAALYKRDFQRFAKWLEDVNAYADYELGKNL